MFINKINSDQPVDEMIDEEMELTQLKEKSEQSHMKYIRQTGHTSKKGSINIKPQQHRESFKNRWFSNTEKDYDCLININNDINSKIEENVKSNGVENHHQSFSFDNNDVSNSKVQDKNIALNKSNHLTYDKKVKAFKNIDPDHDDYIETAKLQSQNSKNDMNRSYRQLNEHGQVISPQPQVSKESFNKMNKYVKNSFRKEKGTGRKNSHYNFSSHRRKDTLKDHMESSVKHNGKNNSKS
jgi:hypothetical protein